MADQNFGGAFDGVMRTDSAVGPDLDDQPVEIGLAANAGGFLTVVDPNDRAKGGVQGNDANCPSLSFVSQRIAKTLFDHDLG